MTATATATKREAVRYYDDKNEYIDGFRYALIGLSVTKYLINQPTKSGEYPKYVAVTETWHDTRDEAQQTFDKIVAEAKASQLAKQCAKWIPADVMGQFSHSLESGDASALMGLADYLSETRGELNSWALLVKAAFHKAQGEENVSVKVGKLHAVLNCHVYNQNMPVVAIVTPGESVRILTIKSGCDWKEGKWVERQPEQIDRTYRIGDTGTTGSYNLVYMAKIAKITAKTVQFERDYGDGSAKTVKIHQFACDHWDFDEVKARKRNSEWMD